MIRPKPAGRGAAARKYDVLTAMGALALSEEKAAQRLILRLMTLITARYNWARNELAVGQREIAQLWDVEERTVKREMAKLRAKGWLVVRRQGARGRVTEYGIDFDRILEATQPRWAAVGPDFVQRMGQNPEPDERVVPLPVKGPVPAPEITDGTEWTLARAVLHAEDPALYGAWMRSLHRVERAGGRLVLRAPSRFHASYVDQHVKDKVLTACQSVDEDVSEVVILS